MLSSDVATSRSYSCDGVSESPYASIKPAIFGCIATLITTPLGALLSSPIPGPGREVANCTPSAPQMLLSFNYLRFHWIFFLIGLASKGGQSVTTVRSTPSREPETRSGGAAAERPSHALEPYADEGSGCRVVRVRRSAGGPPEPVRRAAAHCSLPPLHN